MTFLQSPDGTVAIALPYKLATLTIAVDDLAESGFRFTVSENTAEVVIEEFTPVINIALDNWRIRMNRPGYEPSPITALGQELVRLIEGSQLIAIPAPPPEFDDNGNSIIY